MAPQASGVVKDFDGSENEIGDSSDIVESKVKTSQLRSSAWKCFNIVDQQRKLAECKRCKTILTYRTSVGNLIKHMQRKHGSIGNKHVEDSDNESGVKESKVKTSRLWSSTWNCFNIVDAQRKLAECRRCKTILTYRSSVGNLLKHMQRKHGSIGNKHFDSDNESGVKTEETKSRRRSVVWSYFIPVDEQRQLARCLICNKTLAYSGSITNLRKHLKLKHPLAPLNGDESPIIISTYLDEFNAIEAQDISFAPSKKKRSKERTTKKLVIQDTSDWEVESNESDDTITCDSLDYFGKYAVSLLRKLPKEKSEEMQIDIVKCLMEAQAECVAGEQEEQN